MKLQTMDGGISRIEVVQHREQGKTIIDLVFAKGIHEMTVRLTPVLADELARMIDSELGRASHV